MVFGILAVGISLLGIYLLKRVKRERGTPSSFYEREKTFTFQPSKDFSVHFYGLGLLFVLFLAVFMFFFLWVISFEGINFFGFWSAIFVFFLLATGYLYVWKKGLFE
ncbi:NADH-quinone oxidoreductase subunit A [Alphaproteobacteria bacterium]|nr:NADH-quinone oxidoreductase subunit A [Alphaproteobacteria bacterium]